MIHKTAARADVKYPDQGAFERALFTEVQEVRRPPRDRVSPWQDLYRKMREEERPSLDEFLARNFRTFYIS